MITLMNMYEIVSLKLKGKNFTEISNYCGINRKTVRRYWNLYQKQLSQVLKRDPDADVSDVIESIVNGPRYDTSNRSSLKYNEEIDILIDEILDKEKKKDELLGPNHKQKLTITQIHEMIKAEGHDIGYTTIRTKVNEKRDIHKEAYIKQEYEYGERFEYDFGEIKAIIGGKQTKLNLAVMTAPASKFRWAYLYRTQKMDVFLESQVKFFEMVKGSFKEGVYDNMRNVVSKFIGRNEKELNKKLIQLALYYGFEINVTNCFSGNEKGTVESAVKWIRNKTFAIKYEFDTFEEAEEYLEAKLKEINKDSLINKEMKCLSPYRPPYECAEIKTETVDKYSTVQVDTNFYSVPDYLVGKELVIKKYPNKIKVLYKSDFVCNLVRHTETKKETYIDIKHYLNTFQKKPGALRNSTALKSEPELKKIFDTNFKSKPKEFIYILQNNKDKSIEEIIDIIKNQDNTFRTDTKVESNVSIQISKINDLFIGGDYVN